MLNSKLNSQILSDVPITSSSNQITHAESLSSIFSDYLNSSIQRRSTSQQNFGVLQIEQEEEIKLRAARNAQLLEENIEEVNQLGITIGSTIAASSEIYAAVQENLQQNLNQGQNTVSFCLQEQTYFDQLFKYKYLFLIGALSAGAFGIYVIKGNNSVVINNHLPPISSNTQSRLSKFLFF
jgi:hypothetical protein